MHETTKISIACNYQNTEYQQVEISIKISSMDLERTVIDNIRRIRKEKGISQEKLAEICGTSASYIGLMEIYKNIPKLSTIERIAEALNVDPVCLFMTDSPGTQTAAVSEKAKTRLKKQLMKDLEQKLDEALKQL